MNKICTLLFLLCLSLVANAAKIETKDSLSIVRYTPEKYFKNNKIGHTYLVRYMIYSTEPLDKKNLKFYINDAQVDIIANKKNSYFQHVDYYRYQFAYYVKASDSVYAYRTKLCVDKGMKKECSETTKLDISAKPALTILGMSQDFNNSSVQTAKMMTDEYSSLKSNKEDYRDIDLQNSILPEINNADLQKIFKTTIDKYNQTGGMSDDALISFISLRPYTKYAQVPTKITDYLIPNFKYRNSFSVNELTKSMEKVRGNKILITDMPRRESRSLLRFQKHVTVISYKAPKSQRNDGTMDNAQSGQNYLLNAIKEASSKNADLDNNNIITKDEFVSYLKKNLRGSKGKVSITNLNKNFDLFHL